MALPPGITPKTVTVGVASFFDGTLAEGTATITAPVNVVHTTTKSPILSSQMSKRFENGMVSFDLCPTDAPGLNRVDWTYVLRVVISGALVQPEPIWFTLPTAGPDEIDLDGLVTVPSSAGTPISVDVLTVSDLPGYFETNPPAPGGGAGGALSGSYPNPGLNETAVENIVVNSDAVKGAFGLGATATDLAVASFLETKGTLTRTELDSRLPLGTFIPAGAFQPLAGSPSYVTNSTTGVPAWLMQPSITEVIAGTIDLNPKLPDTVDVDILWTNVTTAEGTVQINARLSGVLDSGSDLTTFVEDSRTFLETAPGQRKVRALNAFKGVKFAPGGRRLTIRTTGTGTLATNDIAILGVYVRPSVRLPATRYTDLALPGNLGNDYTYNSAAFTRDNIVTVGDNQYVVWIDAARKPIIGKRTRSGGTWGGLTTFDLSTIAGNPFGATELDGHNSFSIGVDTAGHIHVAGNHHDDPLRIIRSTTPGGITAWAVPDVSGIPVANRNSVTYPQFMNGPDGALYLWLRQGGSGTGAMFLNRWGGTKWVHVSRPLSGFTVDGNDPDESPYVHTPVIDATGRWHLFLMWRLTDDLATTHDFGYMTSADGVAWTTANGTALPAITNVTASAPAMIFTGFQDQINQCGAAVDSTGRPHSVMWVRNPASSGPSFLRHYWWDGTTWHQDDEVVAPGANPTFRSRPQVLAYGGKVFALYADWPVVGVDGAVQPRAFTRWWLHDVTVGDVNRLRPIILFEQDLGRSELPFDHRGLAQDGLLNVLVTRSGEGVTAYANEPGWLRTFDVAGIIANPPR